ncbi:MAG: preprotein translocase subunit SecA [Spirochaetes bacterium]|nr:MAG: preprotein translocase subunit SecA [Spirochaetota bacterium]RKX98502.1 MAG: preprotein translocase subunit SecA [Spirochaetota bacterium]
MSKGFLSAIFGTKHERDLKGLMPILHAVNAREEWALSLSDEKFPLQTELMKKRLSEGETLDDILPDAFALSREAARRTLGERPYDVQILGAVVLHQGKITEMKTGEGKTLASISAAYLNSLEGLGVHIVTVNDYLAERDANWMKPVYKLLGVSVGSILSNMDPEQRREEYARDITYGTNNEFGFDYLRDNMKWDNDRKAQKHHHYAIIDEIDSILIDEARTPLIISGPVDEDVTKYILSDRLVRKLKECEKDPETGDYPPDDPLSGTQAVGDYKIEEKSKRIMFTNEGMNSIEKILQKEGLIREGSLFDEENFEYIHYFTQALKARRLFGRDKDYVVQEGQVQIVDEFTGRILHGRRYSDGLHQAIEAKENMKPARKSRTLATITFQNYFRMYDKLSGMTGTADTEAREFGKIYNLDVVVIPTNRPVNRVDDDDIIFLNEDYKFNAICDEIAEAHQKGQPVLVGTVSVEKSEKLAKYLTKRGVRYEILNAKNHHREALIIAEAGAKGSITIATNMAGRGTDIKLGGNPDYRARRRCSEDTGEDEYKAIYAEEYSKWLKQNKEVIQAGGLFVLGTERHESRRIDNQLRGRSGRQGDPGYSRFYISLEDDLMRLFGGDKFRSTMSRLGMAGGEPLYHPLINKSLERAQKKVEERNYDIRKHLLEYDDVVSKQRTAIYTIRNEVLAGEDLSRKVIETGKQIVDVLLEDYSSERRTDPEAALKRFGERLLQNFNYKGSPDSGFSVNTTPEEAKTILEEYLSADLEEKISLAGKDQMEMFIRYEYLRQVDQRWQEHLEELTALGEAVRLRSYAQKNPLVEYKNEGFELFEGMLEDLRIDIARKVFKVRIRRRNERAPGESSAINASHSSMPSLSRAGSGERKEASPDKIQIKRTAPKIGRNDPCPCGSGKKYKNCCGS